MPKLQITLCATVEEYKILVCNDGSRDRMQKTLEYHAESMPIEIIRQKINSGLVEYSMGLFQRASEIV